MHGTTLGTSLSNAHAVSGGAGTSNAFSILITRIYPVLDRASATSELTQWRHMLSGARRSRLCGTHVALAG
jgi:hypothetical protein